MRAYSNNVCRLAGKYITGKMRDSGVGSLATSAQLIPVGIGIVDPLAAKLHHSNINQIGTPQLCSPCRGVIRPTETGARAENAGGNVAGRVGVKFIGDDVDLCLAEGFLQLQCRRQTHHTGSQHSNSQLTHCALLLIVATLIFSGLSTGTCYV